MKINGINVDIDTNQEISDFDLEQAIFGAWTTADDLKTLLRSLDNLSNDQVFAAIHGLQILAEARCQRLMDIYKQVLENRRMRGCGQGGE